MCLLVTRCIHTNIQLHTHDANCDGSGKQSHTALHAPANRRTPWTHTQRATLQTQTMEQARRNGRGNTILATTSCACIVINVAMHVPCSSRHQRCHHTKRGVTVAHTNQADRRQQRTLEYVKHIVGLCKRMPCNHRKSVARAAPLSCRNTTSIPPGSPPILTFLLAALEPYRALRLLVALAPIYSEWSLSAATS